MCGQSNLTKSLGKNDLNFCLAPDQAMLLETSSNLCAIERQANDFSQFCFLFVLVKMYNKTFTDRLREKH